MATKKPDTDHKNGKEDVGNRFGSSKPAPKPEPKSKKR
jgi:hypothetical protein